MSLHDGHRQRVRERFLNEGLEHFNEHQVLEMLLFYCCGQTLKMQYFRLVLKAVPHRLYV